MRHMFINDIIYVVNINIYMVLILVISAVNILICLIAIILIRKYTRDSIITLLLLFVMVTNVLTCWYIKQILDIIGW